MRRSGWRPALLSALLGPGAGQFANRERAKGVAFVLATVAAIGVILVRVLRAVVVGTPLDLVPTDLERIWSVAWEIQRQAARELALPVAVLVALWALSIADAWLVSRRR